MPSALLALFVLVSFVSGCALWPETVAGRRLEPGETPVLGRDEVLIFGRILLLENGKSKMPYDWGKPVWQIATPEAAGGKRRIVPFLSTRRDGDFAYVVPAGRYALSHVVPFHYLPMIDPALEFDAGAPGRAYYLGDLEVAYEAWSWLGGWWGNYITRIHRVDVVDRFDRRDVEPAGKALLTRIPGRSPTFKEPFVPPIIHR